MMAPGQKGPEFTVPEARAHFDDAVAAFADKDYAGASESLRLAYELEKFAELLYARAQAERQLEHWDTAASLYSDYLATDPPRDQADNARGPLLFCGAMAAKAAGDCDEARPKLESYLEVYPDRADAEEARVALEACEEEPEPVPPPPAPRVEPTPADPPPIESPSVDIVDSEPPRPWHRDVAGGVLVGSGLAIAAAGTGVALGGRAVFVQGRRSPDGHAEGIAAMDRGIRLERIGIGIAAAGAVVTLVGVARWIAVGVKNRRGTPRQARLRRRQTRATIPTCCFVLPWR